MGKRYAFSVFRAAAGVEHLGNRVSSSLQYRALGAAFIPQFFVRMSELEAFSSMVRTLSVRDTRA